MNPIIIAALIAGSPVDPAPEQLDARDEAVCMQMFVVAAVFASVAIGLAWSAFVVHERATEVRAR